jgi:filamentous hemagglutinin family protein
VKNRAKKVKLDLNKQAKMRLMVGLALCQALVVPNTVYAQWDGLENQHGQATYRYNGNHLDVTVTTSRLIANARSLDIAGNESVSVNQLTANDAALFRSIGPSATKIFGSLTSNGNLFLINQNGVLFGQGAQVDVGGLVASSMNISNADFLSGQYQFNANGGTNSVTNQGVIKVSDGGYLVLLGKEVNNSGTLQANNGSVVMTSAGSAVLDFYGNGLVKANLSGDALNAVVEQSGVIQADGGSVQLAANSRSSAVNVSGLVQANSLVERNGIIRLEGGDNAQVTISGALNVVGNQAESTGGNIEVTGEQVALLSGTKLDASGSTGGGQVLVGGDYQGKNAKVQNATTTYVDKNAKITADAVEKGDGGKAIIWADQITRYYGNISTKGGAQAGNGGFVEVSGKQVLDFIGGVDVSAVNGLGGQVLLDPENIILNTSTQVSPINNLDGIPDLAFADATGTTQTIQINDIRGFSELFLQATNDITVANNITMNTNNSIRLEANNNINVNGQVYTQGTGDITLTANADSIGMGDLLLNRRVISREGNITLSGTNVMGAGQVLTQGLGIQNSGNVLITATQDINLTDSIITNGRNGVAGQKGTNAGNVTLNAGGAISTGNIASSGGRGGVGSTAGGDAGTVTITSTGDISTGTLTARTGNATGFGAGGNVGSINLTGSAITSTGAINTSGGRNGDAGAINLTSTGGDITTAAVSANGGSANADTSGNNAGPVTINAAGGITTANVSANGSSGNGTNQSGGNAGAINIASTAAGDIATGHIAARNGAARNLGTGGAAGSINMSNTLGNINTRNLDTYGNANGHGGDITVAAVGDVTVTGRVYTYGGGVNTGHASVGNNAGNINISGVNRTITSRINANGNAARAGDRAGGNAGVVSITGSGILNTRDIYSRTGNATGFGAGGNVGSINLTGSAITSTGAINTSGGRNGDAGAINLTSTGGDITTAAVSANGGSANADTSGNNAGPVTINAAGGITTANVSANGSSGNGTNQSGGNAGAINIDAFGAITTTAIVANGGNGGSGVGSNANGGGAGVVDINSTGAGDIITTNLTVRSGYARGAGTGSAGSVNIQNGSGAVRTGNINTRGQRRGAGGDVMAIATGGDISVAIVDARASNIPATNGGDVTLATTTDYASVTNILTGSRWLVYSGDPRNDSIGAFKASADFKQYNTNYGDALLDSGNGFIYRFAPSITTSLTGLVTKPYDGNTSASIAGLTLNQTGGEIDGDVITISSLTSAAYDNKNVGLGKTVTSNALTVLSGTNGGTKVYGYQVNAATGKVGVITASALSQAEEAAALSPRNNAGLGDLLNVTQEPQQFLAVFDVDATAAGGDIDPDAEVCETNQDKKSQNPNTSLMLNFGIKLPKGVKQTCI